MFENAEIVLKAPGYRWITVAVQRGTSLRGLICGDVRVVDCHVTPDGVAKPCRRKITKGACPCYCDKEGNALRTYGYLPLITKTGEEVVALLPKTTTQHCQVWSHGTPVEITAPDLEKSRKRIRMVPVDDFPNSLVQQVRMMKSQDISPYLVYVLWGDDTLMKWFDKNAPGHRPAKLPPLSKRASKAIAPVPENPNSVPTASFMVGIGLDPNATQ